MINLIDSNMYVFDLFYLIVSKCLLLHILKCFIDIDRYLRVYNKNDLIYQPFVHLAVLKHFILSLKFLSFFILSFYHLVSKFIIPKLFNLVVIITVLSTKYRT